MNDDIRKGQDSSDTHEESNKPQAEVSGADLSRRKFAKAGLVAAPVIMTLASRPALGNYSSDWTGGGGAGYKCAISGLQSMNASKIDGPGSCHGNTPGYWKNHPVWPNGCYAGTHGDKKKWYNSDGTKFHPKFDGDTYKKDIYGNFKDYTMMQILWNFESANSEPNSDLKDFYELGAHTSAAYLNALASEEGSHGFGGDVTFGLTPQQVIDLYNLNYIGKAEGLKELFQMWNENRRDVSTLQILLGG